MYWRVYWHLVPADDPMADPSGAFVKALTSGDEEEDLEALIQEKLGAYPRVDVGSVSQEADLGGRVVVRQHWCRVIYHA